MSLTSLHALGSAAFRRRTTITYVCMPTRTNAASEWNDSNSARHTTGAPGEERGARLLVILPHLLVVHNLVHQLNKFVPLLAVLEHLLNHVPFVQWRRDRALHDTFHLQRISSPDQSAKC